MNGGWYFLIYAILTLIIMKFINKQQKEKILTSVKSNNSIMNLVIFISRIFRYAIIGLSIFMPLDIYSKRFFVGTLVYFCGLILSVTSMWQFSKVGISQPITSGLYRISRHPMHVMFWIMLFGVAISLNQTFFTVLVLGFCTSSYPMFSMQEKFCIEKYGISYKRYMDKTPRLLLIKSSRTDDVA